MENFKGLMAVVLLLTAVMSTVAISADVELSSNTLVAAKYVMENPKFRKALVLNTNHPVGFPEHLKRKFNLSVRELSGVCMFAMRLNVSENNKLSRKYGLAGFGTSPSEDMWSCIRAGSDNGEISDKIQKLLGVNLDIDS